MGALEDWLEAAADRREVDARVRATDVARNAETQGGLLDLASNDYLSLAGDPRLADAAIAATRRYGTSARASRVVTGTTAAHVELEAALMELTGQPACLVFATGYAANIGILTALGDADTLIVSDAHIHASLIDGARLSRSPVEIFPHGDLAALAAILGGRSQTRAVVVVESIYSVLGDAADLTGLAALCAETEALLLVDEAHGIGVGGGGRGCVHAAGLSGVDHVTVTATMSKALGSQGGAVLGSPLLREHLVNTARTFIFDTGLAPAAAAAATAACQIILSEPDRVEALHMVADTIAAAAGVPRAAGAVQSLVVGDSDAAFQAAAQLQAQGVLVGCFRPPSVPDGISRLRLTARACADLEAVATAAAHAAALAAAHNEVSA